MSEYISLHECSSGELGLGQVDGRPDHGDDGLDHGDGDLGRGAVTSYLKLFKELKSLNS